MSALDKILGVFGDRTIIAVTNKCGWSYYSAIPVTALLRYRLLWEVSI